MIFADDIALISDSRLALVKGIDSVEQGCSEILMQLNKEKSKIVFVKPPRYKSQKILPRRIKGIEVVKSAKYLRIRIDENLNFD